VFEVATAVDGQDCL
jgi:CheY-like chemotaxis protein